MTEDEAKLRWCPFARVPSALMGRPLSYNRSIGDKQIPKATECIASECMAWREDLTRDEAQKGYPAKNGHCGLAGK